MKSFKSTEVNLLFLQHITEELRQLAEDLSEEEIKTVSQRATRRVFEEWTYKGKSRGISVTDFLTPTRKMKIQKLLQRYMNVS